MSDYWARDIVNKCITTQTTKGGGTFWLLTTSKRQLKFLHLKKQCYMDCPYCWEQAMKFIDTPEVTEEEVTASGCSVNPEAQSTIPPIDPSETR